MRSRKRSNNYPISTGNDIVALALTDEARTSRYRFFSRILTQDELPLYDELSGLSFSTFVWLLWSIKEAAYKYASRSNPRLLFTPLKIPVNRVRPPRGDYYDYYQGMVRIGGVSLYSRSFVVPGETVMTVVSAEEDFCHTRWGLHTISDSRYPSQSAQVRAFALESLSMALSGAPFPSAPFPSAPFPGAPFPGAPFPGAPLPHAPLRIVKTPDGPPEVWAAQRNLGIPLSLAHHDRYVAWSYRLKPNPID